MNRKQREKGEARVNQAFSIERSGACDSCVLEFLRRRLICLLVRSVTRGL